jgi:hypothetical protein
MGVVVRQTIVDRLRSKTRRRSDRVTAGSLLVLVLVAAIGLQGLERSRFTSLPRAPAPIERVDLHAASAAVEGGSTWGVYTAIRTVAPGATLFVDPAVREPLDALFVQELGLIAAVVPTDLGSVTTTQPAARLLTGPGWRLLAADGPVDGLVLLTGPNGDELVDVRLTSGWDAPDSSPRVPVAAAEQRPLIWTIVADIGVLLALLLGGGMLLPRRTVPRPVRYPLAFLAGVGLQASLGLLLLPWPWSGLAFLATALAAGLALRRNGLPAGWSRSDGLGLLLSALVITAGATVTRANAWVITSNDSFSFWTGARALAGGRLDIGLLEAKRGIALQSLHAPGFGLGAEGLITLGPMLLVASVAVLGLLPWHAALGRSTVGRAAAAAVAALVASAGWFWFTALYLNAHLLVAALLLLITTLAVIGGDRGELQGLMAAIGVSGVAIILTRAESVLILGLLLLGTLVHHDRWADWRIAWWLFGGSLVAWNGLLLVGGRGDEGIVSIVVLAGLASGAGALAAPTLLASIPAVVRSCIPLFVGLSLWGFTLALALTPLGADVNFFDMVRLNLGEVAGQWYLTAPLVLLIGAFGVAATDDRPAVAPARWLTIGFIPSVLLAKLLDGSQRLSTGDEGALLDLLLSGGGRPGWGDSVNRMWTHGALVALLLIIVAATAPTRGKDAAEGHGRRRAVRPAGIALVVATLVTAIWWRPDHMGPVGPASTTVLIDSVAERPGPELLTDAALEQVIPIPIGVTVPADTDSIRACADVTFTDFGRPNDGAFVISVTGDDGATASTEHQGRSQDAGAVKTTCLDLDPSRPIPAELEVRILGLAGALGYSVAPVLDASGGFVSGARVQVIAPSLDPRSSVMRAVSWSIRAAIRQGPLLIGTALLGILVTQNRRSSARPASFAPRRVSGG